MTQAMIDDVKRIKRELESNAYWFTKQELADLRAINNALTMTLRKFKHIPMTPEFNSEEAYTKHFEISKEYPERYYNFTCFKQTITIWPRAFNHKYALATYGYQMKSPYFHYERGYNGKYMYWNPTDEYDQAVCDWYLAVAEYLATELGITMRKNKKQTQLEFDMIPATNEEVIIINGLQKSTLQKPN